ncbi:MAG: protein-L-isoaspartate(D-aspartate) O-methyltransferase [Candidatus Bathyarchaeota archaeon]|nr:protein-L-isoaspartate(D-aspartate) O-methyltransferase [Candidatus Bathyarchaeota archaeon]MDH5494903.1 protein-L-isoaspartate(D-aspartate) O-methyltransferase [Candidatus Bathyarchaeota archaeon]
MKRETETWEQLVDNLVKERALHSPSVIHAMKQVLRVLFLPERSIEYASMDAPLPIGKGQTVSAPHMVAIMNEALELEVGHNVLEVGAGCGWHAATIGETVAPKDAPRSERGHVYTVEIVAELAQLARENIMRHGFGDRVTVIHGDGSLGYPDHSPYDRILVTAAAPEVPPPLIEQLKIGGVLIIPVGSVHLFQSLIRIRKGADGNLARENLGGVAFVPLTGRFGHRV